MYKPRFHSMILTAMACALFALPAAAESQVRIVRLSDVQGGVQIDKNTGLGFENAFLNLPITQGTQLRTRDNGRAEIEFEDGSTLRLTPQTTVVFGTLGANDAGKRTSGVNLVEGRAYVNWLGKSGDEFTLNFSREKVTVTQPAHFRIAASSKEAEVASFKSELEVEGPSGTVKVDKKKMLTFDADDNGRSTVAKNLKEDQYDSWDKQSVEYHDTYAKNNSTPLGYGYSDLNYYGSYTNYPGYGMLWQPYFTGVGWNPYMDGAWSWYPGMGYMWASAYPWGWMPYYYGNWVYAPGMGWGWQAGGFNTWHGGLNYVGATNFHAPVAPQGTVSAVVVGKGGTASTNTLRTNLVVSRGSAGLGIPRGSVSNLHQLNSQVAKTGWAPLQTAGQFSSAGRSGGSDFSAVNATGPAGAGRAGAGSAHGSAGAAAGHK
ncbi:MAG TPA: FecR family protein [Terriglobales bacterium]|nr:FecR family protein [Terriglobales bacterium]